MQLRPIAIIVSVILATLAAQPASGSGGPAAPDRPSMPSTAPSSRASAPPPGALDDASTKRATMEVAAYTDSDHVSVLTPSIGMSVEDTGGASLTASYLVDVVSAASVDVVSTASSRWLEVRHAGTLSAAYKPHDLGVTVGTSVSSEPDYLSYGAYATVTKDFNEKNQIFFFGYGFSHDTVGRCGNFGACTPFSVFSRSLQRGSFNGGVDFVIDKISLGSVSADVIVENGDQSKPYRYIPMFSPSVAATVVKGATIDWVNQNRLPERPLEQLPLSRRRFAVTGRYAHRFEASTVRLEERLYDDSWGLVASSTDVRWVFDLGNRFELWPHGRFNLQSSVSFWKRAYVSGPGPGWDLPEYRTGDRELGPLWTTEGGLGARWYIGSDAEPQRYAVSLTTDFFYTSFLDDLYLTHRTSWLGASSFMGEF